VVQDTFLALWDRAESFDPATASLGTWLHAIARNRTIDRLRAAGRRPHLVDLSDGGGSALSETEALDRAAGNGRILAGAMAPDAPDAAFLAKETRATIEVAIGALEADERTVIVLAYRDELSQAEIAERLGWPLGTVKTRTRRALRRLRAALEASASVTVPASEDRD
jgi:RNA polymerase sigma-70 factor (ECF subfamily)